jgi:alpha-glucuronidase
MTWQFWSVAPVWLASIAAALIIGLVAAPADRIEWIAITLAGAIITTFVIQLAIRRKEGFVVRTMASIGGAMLVLAVATGVLALLYG